MAPELVPAPLAGLEIRFSREQQRSYEADTWPVGNRMYGGAYSLDWTDRDKRTWSEGLLAMCLFDVQDDLYQLQPVFAEWQFNEAVRALNLLHEATVTVMLAELEAQVRMWGALEAAKLKLADLSVFSPWRGVDKGRGA